MKPKKVKCLMLVNADGMASFVVKGYDFRFADSPISVNGYLFKPVRTKPITKKCPKCKGKGEIQLPPAYPRFRREYNFATCGHCGGTGRLPVK